MLPEVSDCLYLYELHSCEIRGTTPHVLWPPQGHFSSCSAYQKTCPKGESHGLAYHGHLWPPTHPQCADSFLPCYRTVFKQYTSTLHVQSMVQSLRALCAPQTHPSLALLCSTYTYPTHLLCSLQPLSYRYESPANAQPVGRLADLAIPRSSDGVGCGDGPCGK